MVYVFDQCELDLDRVELRVRGQPQPVEPQVFDVLVFLVRNRDRVVSKEELLDEVWHHSFVTESALSSRIKSARRAIGDDGQAQRLIRTVHKRGYQFVGDVRASEPVTAARVAPIPRPATPTIGRDGDIAAVLALLDHAHIVTLLGPGGVGKTRLAAEVALRRAVTASVEVCFVDLTTVRDAQLVPELIVSQLGIHTAGGSGRQTLEEALRGRSLLLVLDNFEHVIDAAELVAAIGRSSPAVQVLTTSRARLRVAGEQVFDVVPLSLDPTEGHPADAVALFAQAATAVDPAFQLEPNLADVVTMCRMVDGLPLAIELAAGHVRTLPPALLRTRLGARLRSAAGAARDAPARQQNIPAMIDWSLALLEPSEQRLFRRLGVFAGPVPLEAVEQVCADTGDVVEALTRLVDQSLVRRVAGSHGEPRFMLLELLRERAHELLASDDEAAMIAARHAAYVAACLEGLEERRWVGAAGRYVDLVNELLSDVRAARAWAHERGEAGLAARITASLGNYWHREGHHAEGRRWVTDALRHAAQLDAELAARLRLTAGFVEWPRDELVAREHWQAATAAFRTLGQDRYQAYSMALASATYIGDRHSYRAATRMCDDAIALARTVGERPLLILALNLKGELTRVQGDDALALAAYEEGKAVALAANDDEDLGMILGNLSFLAEHRGDYAEAHRLGSDALRLCWSIGRRLRATSIVSQLAGPELALGRPERGARLLGAADEALRVLGITLQPGDRSEYERIAAGLATTLGEDRFRRLCAEGARLSLDEAVELALAAPDGVQTTS